MPAEPRPMRFAIFGDIHANLEALTAVLKDAEAHEVTHYVCLGDVVGYNANPHECVEIIQKLDCPVVKGNHDEMASLEDDLTGFNPPAEEAREHSRRMSCAYFLQPNYDSVISPLPACVDDEHPPRYEPITAAGHLIAKMERQYAAS